MDLLIFFLQRTVGQKILVALTGLGLCLFVLIHMLGNLFIFSGPETYNLYAHKIHNLPFLLFLELALFFFFMGHIFLSLFLALKNKKAKGFVQNSSKGLKKGSLIHYAIWFQGLVLLFFLVFHLLAFKFGPYYETVSPEGEKMRDIYKLVQESFKKPLYTLSYSFVLLILFVHFLRGFSVSFRSLGFNHAFFIFLIEKLAWLFSFTVCFGFLAPIWYIFFWL